MATVDLMDKSDANDVLFMVTDPYISITIKRRTSVEADLLEWVVQFSSDRLRQHLQAVLVVPEPFQFLFLLLRLLAQVPVLAQLATE
jgi:tRNA G10  N-methylase Trm11